MVSERSFHAITGFSAFIIGASLIVSGLLIAVGLTAPAIHIRSFYFFSEEYSIAGSIWALFEHGQNLLGSIVLIFTVIFPLSKTALGFASLFTFNNYPLMTARMISAIRSLSRWSMLDVFAIALVVVIINGRVLSSADIDLGVGLFAAGVLLSTLAIHRLERRTVSVSF